MADSSFGLKIGLEGEREFKRAITDINREMRVLGSEMKLMASQFDKNDKSASALTSRNQVLGKEIEAQKAKIQTLKSALDNSATSFGENDSRTKNWQIQLNNAQATLNGLEGELKENNSALSKFADEADGAGDDAKTAAKDTGHLENAVDELGSQMDNISGKTRIFGDALKANLAAEAVVGGVKAIGYAIAGTAKGFGSAMKDGIDYNAKYTQLEAKYQKTLDRKQAIDAEITAKSAKATAIKTAYTQLGDQPIQHFQPSQWTAFIDHAIIGANEIQFVFRIGSEITVPIASRLPVSSTS